MKKKDLVFILVVALIFLPFFLSRELYRFYLTFNSSHGMIMSFVKFALLATLGEVLGLRIKSGAYNQQGFGIVPRALVWGFLGLSIKAAFTIFAAGVPAFLAYLGLKDSPAAMAGPLSPLKLLTAFSISFFMNLIFAPLLMSIHKITDTHILGSGGTLKGLLRPIAVGEILSRLNWKVHWGFVLKKTIPLFWIPAHTITFLLPADFRVLFAALLGIVLGVILAVASRLALEEKN